MNMVKYFFLLLLVFTGSANAQTSADHLIAGKLKDSDADYSGAIGESSQAIELDPTYAEA